MTIIITITLLILAYLFAVGLTEFFKVDKWRVKTLLTHGIPKWAIVVLFIGMAPLVIGFGANVCLWRVKTWSANVILKRKAARLFKAVSKRNEDNPELQKDLKELDDLFKKL